MNSSTTHPADTDHCISVCNRLLRGERSAIETYDKVIDKYGDEPALTDLRRIREEHVAAVEVLSENVLSMGGTPDDSAGAWGAVANIVQGAANLFGKDSALGALQTGEKSGRDDYQSALDDSEVLPGCKDMIRQHLLPRVESHIRELETLQESVK